MKKQTMKRWLLGMLLTVVLPLSAGAAFVDISDPETAVYADMLQMMGVVSGTGGGRFEPQGILTRAQFTKMAVTVLGKENQVDGFRSFTIFPDVKSGHWASGYINYAVRGDKKFISGFSDGTFGPEKNINAGEAVTILMRLLGYKDEDVGLVWPIGYLTAASSAGLTDGLTFTGAEPLTRGQAAQLFANLLSSDTKSEEGVTGTPFCESLGSPQKDVILLLATAKAEDGSPAIEVTTSDGITSYTLSHDHAPTLLQGRKGTLVMDQAGEALAFVPDKTGRAKNISVSTAKAGTLTDQNGESYTVTADIKAFYRGETTTYGDIFVNLRSGTRMTIHYGKSGKIESVYVGESSAEDAIVISRDADGSRLAALAGGRKDYRIRRQGDIVNVAALRAYDVAEYNATSNEIEVTVFRLTGRYDNAYPNTEAPTKITMLGHEFTVLDNARAALSAYKLGDQITIMLTRDAQIAGVADGKKVASTAIGVASATGSTVKIALTEGLTLEGKIEGDGAFYHGQLVRVSSWKEDYLSLSILRSGGQSGVLDLATKKLGQYELASGVQVFERVGKGPVSPIALEDIRLSKVPANRVVYSNVSGGKVDLLILDNVTGDRYTYGIASVYSEEIPDESGPLDPDEPTTPTSPSYVQRLKLKTPTETEGPYDGAGIRNGSWIGLVVDEGGERVSSILLDQVSAVDNSAWENEDSVVHKGKNYAVSEDVICYNRTTGKWVTLGAARAFDGRMTLYVDGFSVVRGVEVG